MIALALRPDAISWDGLRELADVDPVQTSVVVEVIVRDDLEVNEFAGLL